MSDLPNDFIGVRKLKIYLTCDVWTDLEHLFDSLTFCDTTHLPIFDKPLEVFGIAAKTYLLELDHQDFRTHSNWSTKYGIPFGPIFQNVGVKVG